MKNKNVDRKAKIEARLLYEKQQEEYAYKDIN